MTQEIPAIPEDAMVIRTSDLKVMCIGQSMGCQQIQPMPEETLIAVKNTH
jgi:hypothetical protein